jgi:hypothetical protein
MNPIKIIAIGITALFFGLMIVPVQAETIQRNQQQFPIELSIMNADGSIGSRLISLTKDQITELTDIINKYSYRNNRDSLIGALQHFFRHSGINDDIDLFKVNIFDILPGSPIFSIGEGRQYLTRYHGRIQFKKLISTWHYPDNGLTMIIGNNFSPKQVLFQRQMGIMIGFVGIYLYIPEILEHQTAGITCFAGSAMFAWGLSY